MVQFYFVYIVKCFDMIVKKFEDSLVNWTMLKNSSGQVLKCTRNFALLS